MYVKTLRVGIVANETEVPGSLVKASYRIRQCVEKKKKKQNNKNPQTFHLYGDRGTHAY